MNDGGIFLSTDGGSNWSPKSDGLSATEVYHMGNSNLIKGVVGAGTQDNGEIYFNNNTWYTNRGGDWGPHYMFDFANSSTAYYYEDNRASRRDLLTPGGAADANIGVTSPSKNDVYAMTKQNTNLAFIGQGTSLKRTTNLLAATPSWTGVLSFPATIKALGISPTNVNDLFVLTSDGSFWNVTNATGTVGYLHHTGPGTGTTETRIAINKANANIIYVSRGSKVYRSANKGAAWTDISSGLPSANIIDLLHDEYSSNESFYLATATGVYYRNSTMTSWQSFSNGLPTVARISNLRLYNDGTSNSVLRVSFYGRGVWESPLYRFNPGAYYKIVNRNSGKVLDVQGVSQQDNALITQYQYVGGYNQQWLITATADGYYKFVSRNSGKVIENAGSNTSGTKIIQYTSNTGTHQQWAMTSLGNGYFKITNRSSGMALDVPGSSLNDGVGIIQYPYTGGNNQQWQVVDITTGAISSQPQASNFTNELLSREFSDMPSSTISVYPNTASDQTAISIDAPKPMLALIQVADANGNLVLWRRQEVTSGMNNIDLTVSGLPPAIYYVLIRMNEQVVTKRLVIKR
jgi:hypothetical protein